MPNLWACEQNMWVTFYGRNKSWTTYLWMYILSFLYAELKKEIFMN